MQNFNNTKLIIPCTQATGTNAASVPGRIKLLIVSMITINGISIFGVPWGTKCSNIWLVFFIHPNNINLIHKGRAKVNVSVWE